jgi:hypothetical protein
MKKIHWNQIITILATLVVLAVNVLANALPLNGLNTGEISDRFAIYFVPAGYVFSIWGLIYLGLILYTIYQALPRQRDNPILNRIAPYYWMSSLANVVWIFLWHYEVFGLTIVAMLVILASLIVIYLKLKPSTGQDKWLVRLPFSIYLGWISVATVANFSQFLYFFSWDGFGVNGAVWAVIMLAVASLLGLLMAWRESDPFYVLVLVWAFIGIAVSQADTALVVNAAWAGVIALILGVLVSSIWKKRLY